MFLLPFSRFFASFCNKNRRPFSELSDQTHEAPAIRRYAKSLGKDGWSVDGFGGLANDEPLVLLSIWIGFSCGFEDVRTLGI